MIIQQKRLFFILLISSMLLLIPWVAMFFTNEVNWNLPDFIMAGILLFGTGFIFELALSTIHKVWLRISVVFVILVVLLLIWTELAVGIIN